MIPGGVNELLLRSAAAGGATAGRSVRFNSADSAYLSRTPASAGNRRTSTLSFWTKKVTIGGGDRFIFSTSGDDVIRFNSDNKLRFYLAGTGAADLESTQLFRDPSAWYHFVFAFDTTQGTASDRIKVYLNGVQITAWGTATYPSQNYDMSIGNSVAHYFGRDSANANHYNGYLALVHYVNGQALTPSSFGETSATTGQWIAKTYSGSYGTNGFFLDFLDNSAATATTLGKDTSGNGNNWTPNNLSVTAGSGNDSLRDHPTSAGTSTGLGGEVSGNYCTINPLTSPGTAYLTISNGNLDQLALTETVSSTKGTIGVRSGKWYWEVRLNILSDGGVSPRIGICRQSAPTISQAYGVDEWCLFMTSYNPYGGQGGHNNSFVGTYSPFQVGDIGMFALDMDNAKIYFGKNGTWLNSGNPVSGTGAFFTDVTGEIFPLINTGYYTSVSCNFGQRAFAYTAPSGFSPLVDTLLPTPTIAKPNTVMDVLTYTGNGVNDRVITTNLTTVGLVWIKSRNLVDNHRWLDVVRGANNYLGSNLASAENSASTLVRSFSGATFTLGTDSSVNTNNDTYVAWTFDAGSSNATNTSGEITSTVRANLSAGFSIFSYTGPGYSVSVGHGLGAVPKFAIFKNRTTGGTNWIIYHGSLGPEKYMTFTTAAATASGAAFANNSPDSLTLTLGSLLYSSSASYVCYAWTPVAGYSAFGSYTGNGSTDGPFVYTGFRSRWVLIKRTDSATNGNWRLFDTARSQYNIVSNALFPNLSDEEGTLIEFLDIVSNGFKIKSDSQGVNASSGTYIYACFAENPLAYARAR